MGSSFSKELDILCGFPHESIFGPLLFIIDIYDLFFIDMSSDIVNYANDTTHYKCAPYYDKLTVWNWRFTKYLIGLSLIISKLMLLNVLSTKFLIHLSVCYHNHRWFNH